MAITYKVTQQHAGGVHDAIFVEDNLSQRKIGTAVYDLARNQFAFVPADHDVVLSAADKTTIVAILNGLTQ